MSISRTTIALAALGGALLFAACDEPAYEYEIVNDTWGPIRVGYGNFYYDPGNAFRTGVLVSTLENRGACMLIRHADGHILSHRLLRTSNFDDDGFLTILVSRLADPTYADQFEVADPEGLHCFLPTD